MAYPDGAIRAQFSNSSIIAGSVEAVYGTSLIDFTGEPTLHYENAECGNMSLNWEGCCHCGPLCGMAYVSNMT